MRMRCNIYVHYIKACRPHATSSEFHLRACPLPSADPATQYWLILFRLATCVEREGSQEAAWTSPRVRHTQEDGNKLHSSTDTRLGQQRRASHACHICLNLLYSLSANGWLNVWISTQVNGDVQTTSCYGRWSSPRDLSEVTGIVSLVRRGVENEFSVGGHRAAVRILLNVITRFQHRQQVVACHPATPPLVSHARIFASYHALYHTCACMCMCTFSHKVTRVLLDMYLHVHLATCRNVSSL